MLDSFDHNAHTSARAHREDAYFVETEPGRLCFGNALYQVEQLLPVPGVLTWKTEI